MTKLEEVPEQKVTKFINKTSTELGLRERERPDIQIARELSNTGTQGDVAYSPEDGRFKVRLRPDLDWMEAQRVIRHELGHIQSSGNEYIKVYNSNESEEFERLKETSNRELDARVHEANLAGRSITKMDLADWIIEGCATFGMNRWKQTRNYMMNVARQRRISPKVIKDAVSLVDEYYGSSPKRRPHLISYYKD